MADFVDLLASLVIGAADDGDYEPVSDYWLFGLLAIFSGALIICQID